MKQRGFSLVELLISMSILGILSTTIIGSIGSSRNMARDTQRVSDIQQILVAMELNRSIYSDEYTFVSNTIPSSIGNELAVVPKNNFVNGGEYYWLPNVADPTEFCVWTEVEDDAYGHLYYGNPYGRGYQDETPTTFEECRFYKDEHTVNNNNSGDDVIELCHFPQDDPDKQKTIIVPSGETDGHLNNHSLDHLGTCLNEGKKGRNN